KEADEKLRTSNIAENSVKISFFYSYELQVTSYKWKYQIALFPAEKLSYCYFQRFTIHYSLLIIHYKKQNAFSLPPDYGVFCAQRRDGGQKSGFSNDKI
ncbi:MAG: hypothetical protein LBS88_03825, partial [Tannerellaceae bacterium]|nr:hypothetical protein [Tannerellaceae bacterium]